MQIYNDYCTGCGLCTTVCPQKCIKMEYDILDNRIPQIDDKLCVNCGKCNRSCPQNNIMVNTARPEKVYVGWNCNNITRCDAASGGIASAIYSYSFENGIHVFGVRIDNSFNASYIEIKCEDDIDLCRNSKYVFSDILPVLDKVREYSNKNEKVIFIGLPCQVAAVKKMCCNNKNIITIDLVCHGSCSNEYLIQYINFIARKFHFTADSVRFRDPRFGTKNYMLTINENGIVKYKNKVHSNDLYQMAYHYSLDYRDSCYNCHYSKPERVGDITLSDFSGIGKVTEFKDSTDSISCIMVSTDKGNNLINELVESGYIVVQQRPVEEAFKYEPKLKHPPKSHSQRSKFIETYKVSKDFVESAKKALKKDIIANTFKVRSLKRIARRILKG